jgi:DNA-binding response OmpR family regulator
MAYIIIVDDDEDFAAAAATVLEDAGHEVAIELEIDGAMASMKNRCPDLAVLDVMFPEDPSAGFALARDLRACEGKLKRIPVLMLTAVNAKFPLGFGTKDIDDDWLPISDFLEKPVDFDVLREKVAALLDEAAARADREA